MQRVAKRYFGESLVYCDAYNSRRNCGCKTIPCVNPARTFAKNHDFGLRTSGGVTILASERYFIQYRSPVRSIVSNYHLYLRNHPDECKRSDWERFALQDLDYWIRFMDKWVLNFPKHPEPPLYCSYESLLSDPATRMREILAFLSDEPLDDEAVDRAFEKRPIAPRDRLSAFDYYDPTFFRELEDGASERLSRLNLPSFRDEI